MEVGKPLQAVAPLVADRPYIPPTVPAADEDEVNTLPFPENFVGTFGADGRVQLTTERLAFEVGTVATQDDLFKAVAIRYEAYSRHLPELARRLRAPEPADTEPGYTVLLAENRLDSSPLATVRLQTNEAGPVGRIEMPWP